MRADGRLLPGNCRRRLRLYRPGSARSLHGINPFVVGRAFPADTIIPYLAFPNEPSQYGPLWALVGTVLANAARADLLADIVLYKLVGALAQIGSALLILKIAPSLGAPEGLARAGAFAFLWNPLLLWEMVGNAHNDGLMMLGVLLGVWFLVTDRNLLVLPALMLGRADQGARGGPGPLTVPRPLAAQQGHRNRGLLARPARGGDRLPTLLGGHRHAHRAASHRPIHRLARQCPAPGARAWVGQPTATNIARLISLGGFGIVVVAALVRAWLTREIVPRRYGTMLGAALLATTWFQAWYLVLADRARRGAAAWRRHLEIALLSLGGFLQYLVFIYLWVIGVFPPEESLALQLSAFVGIVGPAVLAVVVWRYARRDTLAEEAVRAD